MNSADLALLLDEAYRADWESLRSALSAVQGQPHPRIGWLTQHLAVVKRGYAQALHAAIQTPTPPPDLDLDALCRWEVEMVSALTPARLEMRLASSGQTLTVADLLRLNARQTTWHAGQIAAHAQAPRTA
ncbi:hypothetical protein [Deinococcus sp.]|uniref:hypothetical protein n=1 Tax=Deinococcus sp. TaxID=47478 RepID=UPI003CC53357